MHGQNKVGAKVRFEVIRIDKLVPHQLLGLATQFIVSRVGSCA